MATARERYLNAVSPRSAASEKVSPSAAAAAAANAASSVPPATTKRSARNAGASTKTSEMTSPALTPRGSGRGAIAASPRSALSSSSANGRSPAATASASTAGGNATASPASKPTSGRKPGGGTSRAVEARLSAAMAIYAGAASAGPVSDDDYFTDDGRLDHDKIVSPRHHAHVNGNANAANAANAASPPKMNGVPSPTSAGNARLTGAAPPPTLGEIESHLNDSHGDAPPSNMASPSPGNSGNTKRTAAASSAERKANRGTAGDKGALHDPFGTMPSLPTPTAESTSVAARRRARAAAAYGIGNLSVDTSRTPTAAAAAAANNNNAAAGAGDATGPATMLDFALQGTPAADGTNAGYISSDDDDEREGVLGAVASPKSWKGASASARSKLDTSREGLIGADDLSPTNAPTVMSDAEARMEEERERREAEEKKNRFLSKMIMRGKKEKKLAATPKPASAISKPDPEVGSVLPKFSEAAAEVAPSPSSSPMAADRSNVVDSNQMVDDPPLDIVDADDSSDEENNLVENANKLASAMMELLGTDGSDNTSSGAKQQTKARADPFEFAPIGGGQSGTTRSARGAVDAPDDEPPSLRPAARAPAVDAKPQDAVEAMRTGPSVLEFIDLGDPSLSAKPSFADKFAQKGMDRRSSAQRFAAASNGGTGIYQPSLTSSRSISSDSPGGAGSRRRTSSGGSLRTLSSKKAEKPQSILRNGPMTPPRTKAPPVKKAARPDLNDPNLDPIQRAGIRLLSAAAIPIQTEVRRYLARRRTLAMFRALVRIQCFVRRWKAERHLRASVESATHIQAAFRGWIARDTLEDEHYCATQIQRIVRGHFTSIRVYKMIDELRRHRQATVIQTAWRTYSAELSYQFDIVDIIIVQSIARRKAAYREAARLDGERRALAATKIQAAWRSHGCTMSYLHTLADVLIAQSAVRRWMAMKAYPAFREQRRNESATQIQRLVRGHLSRNQLMWYFTAREIQAAWRGYVARRDYQEMREYLAAVEIQRAWRGFQCFTDYVFTIADVVVAQRTARQWLARRKVNALREVKAATTIQAAFRGYSCHMTYLYSLVNVIIVQSVARKWLQAKEYPRRLQEDKVMRVQALYRGYRVRSELKLQHESATSIQSMARRSIATNKVRQQRQVALSVSSAAKSMRERNASRKIQRAWRICVIRQSEDEAARIIQRFFIFVKKEVDRELARMENEKGRKRERKRREKKEDDDKLLERVWLTTVDSQDERAKNTTPKRKSSTRRTSKSVTPQKGVAGTPDRSRSDLPPRMTINADDQTEVSGLTYVQSPSRFKNMSRKELKDDLSLEEAWIDTEVQQAKEKMRSERDYIKRHGLEPIVASKRESSSSRRGKSSSKTRSSSRTRTSDNEIRHSRSSRSSRSSKNVEPSGMDAAEAIRSSSRQKSSSRTRRVAIDP